MLRRRQDPRQALAPVVATTAISLDAWFDMLTATTAAYSRNALLMLPVEIATSAVTATLAARSWPARVCNHAGR